MQLVFWHRLVVAVGRLAFFCLPLRFDTRVRVNALSIVSACLCTGLRYGPRRGDCLWLFGEAGDFSTLDIGALPPVDGVVAGALVCMTAEPTHKFAILLYCCCVARGAVHFVVSADLLGLALPQRFVWPCCLLTYVFHGPSPRTSRILFRFSSPFVDWSHTVLWLGLAICVVVGWPSYGKAYRARRSLRSGLGSTQMAMCAARSLAVTRCILQFSLQSYDVSFTLCSSFFALAP